MLFIIYLSVLCACGCTWTTNSNCVARGAVGSKIMRFCVPLAVSQHFPEEENGREAETWSEAG